jgi:hypothetical protein
MDPVKGRATGREVARAVADGIAELEGRADSGSVRAEHLRDASP